MPFPLRLREDPAARIRQEAARQAKEQKRRVTPADVVEDLAAMLPPVKKRGK